MPNIIKTIYKNGVFKPLEKIRLPENTEIELATLLDYSSGTTAKGLLGVLKYAKEVYKRSKVKLSPGLAYQRKIRKTSDTKINLRLKELNV